MTDASFIAFPVLDGERITLSRTVPSRLPFGKAATMVVPFAEWPQHRPADAAGGVAAILRAIEDAATAPDGAAMVSEAHDGVILHPAFVAALAERDARAIGLPDAVRLLLELNSRGLPQRDDFAIDARWIAPGGMAVRGTRTGARLRADGREWRVPEPIFSTLLALDAVNAAQDDAVRQQALSLVKQAIGDGGAGRIAPDGLIAGLRLSYAAGFSLDLSEQGGEVRFDPVLFGREPLHDAGDGRTIDADADGLLPPALRDGFVRRFRQGDGRRTAYLLDDGSILYVDPGLAPALAVVRAEQAAPSERRRAFASNPQGALAEALGEAAADAVPRFIETEQFSQRVLGIDTWRKPVLPWIKPGTNSWLPESFGLRVGEGDTATLLTIPLDRLGDVARAAHQAVREERSTFDFDGTAVPATQQTLAALSDLTGLADTIRTTPDAPPPREAQQRFFLQIRDNLEDIAYAPIVQDMAAADTPPPPTPAALRSDPKPHQRTGFAWLVANWRNGRPGAVLADDMGLGKTYQALAFLAWLRETEAVAQPVLIVAPTGLLGNWRAEIDRHLGPGALGSIVNAYGSELAQARGGAGRDIERGAAGIAADRWAGAGVVLTTYETMRDYHLSFARIAFSAILYDEAQKLKNPASQMTRAAKTLNARFQLAMTGTPVENRLQDLWSILDVVHPGLLGSSRQFETDYPAEPEPLAALHSRLTIPGAGVPAPMLRRMKDECLDSLPAKRIVKLPVPMPPVQAIAYSQAIARALVAQESGEPGRMLTMLHALRGISLHPHAPEEGMGDPDYCTRSARIATLMTTLDTIAAQGEKVLIFCESIAMQALLADEIRRRHALPHDVSRIHGGVPGPQRQILVDAFQTRGPGFDAMILSPKAGGVGLTLTAANHVVHLSRWWNPAVEDQATDRAYRIGQTRDVTVYLPQAVHPDPQVADTSFDLRVDALMEAKRSLSRGLLAPGDDDGDIATLFGTVVNERAAEEPIAAAVPAPVPPVVPAPAPTARTRLGLRARPAPVAAPVPPPPVTWSRRVVYEPGRLRDFTIFERPLAGRRVRSIAIRDPYACSSGETRQWIVELVHRMVGAARAVDHVAVTTRDADSIQSYRPETTDEQRSDLLRRWTLRFGATPRLTHQALSRREKREFHDRGIRAEMEDGSELTWDLGRGVEGVMNLRRECSVTLIG